MTQFNTQLETYEGLIEQQREQIDAALEQVYQQIEQQLQTLQQQEQTILDAQAISLECLRSDITADARCLLPTGHFRQVLATLLEDRQLYGIRALRSLTVSADSTTWLIATLPVPLEITQYEMLRDDSAYNDENYYTEYSYTLTGRLGRWQRTLNISTASLSPGHPMRYSLNSLLSQHHQVLSAVIGNRVNCADATPDSEFSGLELSQKQALQLMQEIGCLLVFVGDLFNIHPHVERFCYPQERCEH